MSAVFYVYVPARYGDEKRYYMIDENNIHCWRQLSAEEAERAVARTKPFRYDDTPRADRGWKWISGAARRVNDFIRGRYWAGWDDEMLSVAGVYNHGTLGLVIELPEFWPSFPTLFRFDWSLFEQIPTEFFESIPSTRSLSVSMVTKQSLRREMTIRL